MMEQRISNGSKTDTQRIQKRIQQRIQQRINNGYATDLEETEEAQKWPVWESGAARFQESRWWEARPGVAEERCYIISGAANLIISEETNNANAGAITVRIEAGDRVVFRKGFTCEWEVGEEGISKHYEYFDASGEKFKNE